MKLRLGQGESLVGIFSHIERGCDSFGCGHFGASRGDRKHNGTDLCVAVLSPIKGRVTRLGYPYKDDLSFRYVEITDEAGFKVRLFYVLPKVTEGDFVGVGDVIGKLQSLQKRYEGIQDHVHLEVLAPSGEYVDWKDYESVG